VLSQPQATSVRAWQCVDDADRILEELPPLKRGLAIQMRVIEAIFASHRPELPPAELDARMDRMVKAFHGRPVA